MQGLLSSYHFEGIDFGTIEIPPAPQGGVQLRGLLESSIILQEDWDNLPGSIQSELSRTESLPQLLPQLVRHGMLTQYQATRIQAGTTYGLVLGNYRILDRLGAGGMAVVFKGEHVDMRRPVAIKVLPLYPGHDPKLLRRFISEMRSVAQLQHPNIVVALDAGKCEAPNADDRTIYYFVMELIPGMDLEESVRERGPLSPTETCDLGHQVASALMESNKNNLVHRDIKPSNIRVTPDGQAKLLDFGLARHWSTRLTQPGTLLGTMDYIAPEQAHDATTVDVRADIYGLGGTLFWCLTGHTPFKNHDNLVQAVACRITQPPPSVRASRLEVPVELDAIVAKMMALHPEDRYQTPQAVMEALVPFLRSQLIHQMHDHTLGSGGDPSQSSVGVLFPDKNRTTPERARLLVVDDESQLRDFCLFTLQSPELECDLAADGAEALEKVKLRNYDVVLLDVDMPGIKGPEVCRRLRESPPCPNLKIVMMSGRASADQLAEIMLVGADDYLTKPLSVMQLQAHIRTALRLKKAQDRSDHLNQRLLTLNQQLEENLHARDSDLVHARSALALSLAEMVACRDGESSAHLPRMQQYCRSLAEEAAHFPVFAQAIDQPFITLLEACVPLHDIGKIGLPDHILLKPGKLTADERYVMQTHTTIGAETLERVADRNAFARPFLQMAIDIVRHHHERFDGQGYPDRLGGNDIPLSARIATIADVYDALRSRRIYKPALSHDTACRMMVHEFAGQFDPYLLKAFARCACEFEKIYQENPN